MYYGKSQSLDAASVRSSTLPFMKMMRAQFGPQPLLCAAAKTSQEPGTATPASGVKVRSVVNSSLLLRKPFPW